MSLKGINQVKLVGFLRNSKLKLTNNGNARFQARIFVPIEVERAGRKETVEIPYNIGAWGTLAEALDAMIDGTPLEISGTLSVRSYDSRCKSCGADEKKYWTEVNVSNFVVQV